MDSVSTCSTPSTSVVRVVRGKTTKYYEHPPATGNMAPANAVYRVRGGYCRLNTGLVDGFRK